MAKTSRYLKPKCKRSETIIIFELSRFGRINFKDVFCSFPSPLLFLMETYLYLELIIQVPTYLQVVELYLLPNFNSHAKLLFSNKSTKAP